MGTQPIENATLTKATGKSVLLVEALPVAAGQEFDLAFVAAGTAVRHGVWLAVDGTLDVAGIKVAQVELWRDTAPPSVRIRIVDPGPGVMWFYNIWKDAQGQQMSQTPFAGMAKVDAGPTLTYRCNSRGPSPTFDALAFTLTRR